MLFNSYIFILIFLPICILGYYLLCKFNYKVAYAFLLGMSLWFYGYANPRYLLVILGSMIFNYAISRAINHSLQYKKMFMIVGIVANVAVIFYFKYFMFSLGVINTLFRTNLPTWFIELPLGISFFTFQQISFVVDSYRGETKDYSILEYALYVSFFPQLVAGPIVFHSEMIPQFRDFQLRKVNFENIIRGIILFTCGLFKKLMVADILMVAVDWGYENYEILTSTETILVFIAFTLQLYFDFSAYSDMATGIAGMFNWTLPINFDSPLKSLSISEFWRRWHITLNRFLTQYIYIPLGGSRKGKLFTYLNLIIVFGISGIWHGAYYTFIIWGLLNGIACVLHRIFAGIYDKLWKVLKWIMTFGFTTIAFGLFRSDSVRKWIYMLGNIFTGKMGISSDFMRTFEIHEISAWLGTITGNYPYITMVLIMVGSILAVLFLENNYRRKVRINGLTCVITAMLLSWCVFTLSSVTKFLYFNF